MSTGEVLRVRTTTDADIIGFLPVPSGGQVVKVIDARVEDNTEDTPC